MVTRGVQVRPRDTRPLCDKSRWPGRWHGVGPADGARASSRRIVADPFFKTFARSGDGFSLPKFICRGGREFLFLVADIPDADYFARCVLDRVITGHVWFAEDVDFAVESLTFVDIRYRFSLRVQDGPKRPTVYAARHIGGYADIIITRLYEERSRAAGLSLDLVDNREVVVHLG